MPGYSGTPLPKKLGIKPGFRVLLQKAPAEVRSALSEELTKCDVVEKTAEEPIDFALAFTKSRADLDEIFAAMNKSLSAAGMVWVSWPKKTSGVATDVGENVIREAGLRSGLVDVKVCAVTDVWSGLKFVGRVKDRGVESKRRGK